MSQITSQPIPAATTGKEGISLAKVGLAAAGAAATNLIVYTIGRSAAASMTITSGAYNTISAVMVAAFSLLPILAAGGITHLIVRRRPGFLRWARGLGLAVALLSGPSPLVVAADTQTGLSLAVMHLVAAAAWFYATTSTTRQAA